MRCDVPILEMRQLRLRGSGTCLCWRVAGVLEQVIGLQIQSQSPCVTLPTHFCLCGLWWIISTLFPLGTLGTVGDALRELGRCGFSQGLSAGGAEWTSV